ncbi:ADP-ribosyl-[dinitrogen reductase] hydrolase [Andreprevotia lacus DSM 23236]|jgi:ADP-ribosyl-[dinitrogen reductase] hydrolase|uniref:ADP-ribosyl-[dinitrogen reductase] hydrolase n=1 Tax=Andreprevotia lacus DSM 23236 TaxID=1121001 RepID=A0A1W1X6N0_9NEIS|nr:ADP-ribosylglycohydrolase family protein [Andreprevotia lacus]SMC19619.1 ADP-ribosyl-[dinitrogen reductase] hydrolase [Andreprevotia lacus DSM 23236]
MTTLLERYRGCLLGLACGDAVGTTVEFSPRGSFAPVTDMTGGGPFDLPPGAWTDDCAMALCLAHSLLHRQGFDATDQMNRYCNWASYGYMSSTGACFDIGVTVAQALQRYRASGDPYSGSSDPRTAGNGALMRLAPIPMFYFEQADALLHHAAASARTTHGAEEVIESTRLFATQLHMALQGAGKDDILFAHGYRALAPKVQAIAAGDWRDKPREAIRGSGYVIESLEAALWCFLHGHDFASTVLLAANLGDDADTTAAICGQLAGAHYGVASIPPHWLHTLVQADEIGDLADRLHDERAPALAGEAQP